MKKISFNRFETIYLIVGLSFNLILAIVNKSPFFDTVYALSCVLGTVLITKARLEGYFFETLSCILYAFIAIRQKYYSEALITAFVVPITLYGAVNWIRKHNHEDNTVNVSRMSRREAITVLTLTALLFPLLYYLISLFNESFLLLQTMSLVLSILATYFTARMSSFNYVFYIIKDVTVAIMWFIPFIQGETSAATVFVSLMFFLVIDSYGLYSWRKMYRKQSEQ